MSLRCPETHCSGCCATLSGLSELSKHCLRVFDRHFALTMDSMLDKLAENVSENAFFSVCFLLVCTAKVTFKWQKTWFFCSLICQEFISVCVGNPRLVKKDHWRSYVDYEISLHASTPHLLVFLGTFCLVGSIFVCLCRRTACVLERRLPP